jgi:hypothetical protein
MSSLLFCQIYFCERSVLREKWGNDAPPTDILRQGVTRCCRFVLLYNLLYNSRYEYWYLVCSSVW